MAAEIAGLYDELDARELSENDLRKLLVPIPRATDETARCELVEFHDGSFCRLSAIKSVKVVPRFPPKGWSGVNDTSMFRPARLEIDCGTNQLATEFQDDESAQQEAVKIKRLIQNYS